MPFDLSTNNRTFVINGDCLKFNHSVDQTVHILADDDNTLNFTNDTIFDKSISTDTIKSKSGDELFSYDNTNDKLLVKSNIDFANSTVSNLTNLTLNSSQILSSNLSGQSGDTSIDAEIDSLITSIGNNTNRTSGLTANRIMRSNNAGTLQIATFDTDKILRNNLATQQEIVSDLNFASGKKVLYNGNQVALTDIGGYTALQNEVDTNSAKTSITSSQASAIVLNTAKTGITTTQRDNILANNSKVSITTTQRDNILANNSKVGITTTQRDNILTNNSKVGITTTQRDNILTNNSKVALSSAEYSKIQSLPAVADINAMAHTNDSSLTLFANDIGCGSISGSSALLGSNGFLAINATNDDSSISFDQDVDGGGFVLSNDSGDLAINTNIDITSGHKYKIANSDLNFSHLAGTVADNQIVSSIARVSAVNTLLDAKVNKSTPTFTGISNGFAKITNNVLSTSTIADGDLPSTITRDSELGDYLKKDGSVVATGNIQVPQLNITDANHSISKDGNGDINFTVPSGDIHKFKIGSSTIANVDSGGVDLASGKVFSIDGTTLTGISTSQASAISANTAKTGITSSQSSAITANTAKTGITSSQSSAITANTAKTGITSSQSSAITANTAKTGITSSQATDITNSYKNNDNIIIPDDKNIYRAYTDTGALGTALYNKWITIAVCPNLEATSGRSGRYANTTISMNDIGRQVFCKFTISVINANFTINIDNGGLMWDDNTGLAEVRLVGVSNTGYSASSGALFQIFAKHTSSRFEIYEHASNLISNGFSIVSPVADLDSNGNRTRTTFTQISTGNTLTVINVSNFGVRDSINIKDFGKDFTLDFPSQSLFDADYLYRCGQIAYFKKRVVLESASEDIFQTHAKVSANNSNGLFYRMNAIDGSPTWVAITPASGYETGATTANTGRLEYAIVGGKQVFIRGEVKRTGNYAFTNNQVLFVLPSAIRPKYSFYAPLYPQLSGMLYFYGTNQDSTGDVTCTGTFNNHLTVINVNYLLD